MSKKMSLIIFTDVGEEIDDEIALFWFFNYVYDVKKYEVTIVFTEGVLGASITPLGRFKVFKKYFPHAPISVHYVYELSELREMKGLIYDKMLQIAPLRGVPVDFFTQNKIKVLYLMGQRSPHPGSINTCKSFDNDQNAIEEYNEQLKHLKEVQTISIPTKVCRKVPLSSSLVQKLPEQFRSQIFEKVYEQFVGRVAAHLPYCYDVTFNVNYQTMMRYIEGDKLFASYKQVDETSLRISDLAQCFYDSIDQKPVGADSAIDVSKLKEMILVVEFLTEGYYRDDALQKGPKHFGMYRRNFGRWREKVIAKCCSLTPAYDLLAMFVMVEEMSQNDLMSFNCIELSKMLEDRFL